MNSRTIVSVEDVMTPEPVLLRDDDSLPRAARTLEEYEISGAPVVDCDGALVGVLSESDLVAARASEQLWARWPGLRVQDLMHAPVITADARMTVQEAATVMRTARIHRLVVVAEDQRTPIGMISTSDLVRAMVGEREGDDGDGSDDDRGSR